MPVSEDIERLRGELDRLQERLDQFEKDTEEIVTAAYVESLREAVAQIEARIAELETDASGRFEPDPEVVGAARHETLQGIDATQSIWEQWQTRLRDAEALISEGYELSESVGGSDTPDVASLGKETLESLRGQWPTSESPVGSGLAGRFYDLSSHHRRQLADAVTRQALGGATPRELRQELAERLEASEEQARQQVRDATIQHSRDVNREKAEELGYEYFEYTGPMDMATRPFCRGVLNEGPVFSREEISAMDNGQTGAGTVMVAGGGYRCRHHWQQVRERWFTDDEWEDLRGEHEELPKAVEEAEDEYREDQKELRDRQSESEQQTRSVDVERVEVTTADGETREIKVRKTGESPSPGEADLRFHQAGNRPYEVAQYDPDLELEDRRWAAQDNWVHGPNRKGSVLMKEATRRELGVSGRLQSPRGYRFNDKELEAMQDDVRHFYEQTQQSIADGRLEALDDEWRNELKLDPDKEIDQEVEGFDVFDKDGEKHVRLYRGLALSEDMDPDDYERGVLESWTADHREAKKHAERNASGEEGVQEQVFEEEIPASKIVNHKGGSEWHDGYFGDQKEFIVLSEEP